jgi:hypothetical protein
MENGIGRQSDIVRLFIIIREIMLVYSERNR